MIRKPRTSSMLAFLDVDLSIYNSGESSSDESFKIENHKEDSDFTSSSGSDSEGGGSDSEDDKSSDDEEPESKKIKADDVNHENQPGTSSAAQLNTTEKLLEQTKANAIATAKLLARPVCCACLGDRSDDSNEIVECDGCKITVHEGCYGVSESVSVSSTVSSCSTEPWFCEACKANVKDPDCELCPNRGGIFKETDCGKWVHLVCALYVPGIAFGDVDQLSNVTLFEMQYNKWGSKTCTLCEDKRFERTGVCIGCDAGMCKTYFHVTCAQKAGFLSEPRHDEVDPYYAHCKSHSDKTQIKNRKRNYNALLVQIKHHEAERLEKDNSEKSTPEQDRIERKLKKHRIKYTSNKLTRVEPWVPTQKMTRMLNTSSAACNKLMKKADLMGIDAVALEFQEAQIASLVDIRKKWHIPPAFSTEFVGYYLDRSIRIKEIQANLEQQIEANKSLLSQQQTLRTKYDDAIKVKAEVQQRQDDLTAEIQQLHTAILNLCPNKQLPMVESIARQPPPTPAAVKMIPTQQPTLSSTPPPQLIPNRTMSVPTAAALKMGVGFPLNNLHKDDTGRILSTQRMNSDALMNECGTCKKCSDQHLLAKCDTCHRFYHLGCLNPPLTRHPKRSKLYAWQCSECDKSDDSGHENNIIPKGPRRSRIRYSKDGPIIPDLRDSFGSERSMKSDESHKAVNGSGVEVVKTAVNETLPSEIVPTTTSTPLPDLDELPAVKKRGRKPKSKPSLDNSSGIDTSGGGPSSSGTSLVETIIPDQSAVDVVDLTSSPSKEKVKKDKKEKKAKVVSTAPLPAIVTSPESSPPKVVKKGRPKKAKPSILEISESLQEKQEIPEVTEPKPEVTVISVNRKVELPLEQFMTSVPHLATAEIQPKLPEEPEAPECPVITISSTESLPPMNYHKDLQNGSTLNGDGAASSCSGHKNKKKKKRRHSNSPSSGERSSSTKKKKRKHKQKDLEFGESQAAEMFKADRSPEQPPIKMKFSSINSSGKGQKWKLSSADDHSVEEYKPTFNDLYKLHQPLPTIASLPTNGHTKVIKKRKKPLDNGDSKKARLTQSLSVIAPSHFATAVTSAPEVLKPIPEIAKPLPECCVCFTTATSQESIKCDECAKVHHFGCLIPPLKKTPKKRGYSWHCADCDPTDRENN